MIDISERMIQRIKNRKDVLFLLVIILSSFYGFGEIKKDSLTRKKYTVSIRLNNHYNHYVDFDRYAQYYPNSKAPKRPTTDLGNISGSIVFYNKKNFTSHEIDLLDINIYSSYKSDRKFYHSVNFLVSYQFNYFFLKSNDALFSPYAGASMLAGYYTNHQGEPGDISRKFAYLNQINFVPGVKTSLSNRLYLDFSIPITIFRASGENYSSGPYQKINDHYDVLAFFKKNYYQARLGLGLVLNSSEKNKDKEKFSKTVRFNFNSSILHSSKISFLSFEKRWPSLTFQNKRCKSMVHELDIPNISVSVGKLDSSFRSNDFSVSMRYQLSYLFFKQPVLINPYLGIGIIGNYRRHKVTYEDQPDKNSSSMRIQHDDFISSGIQIHPNEKMYIDVSVPLIFFGSGINKTNNASAISKGGVFNALVIYKTQQTYYYVPNTDVMNVRIGVGFKL